MIGISRPVVKHSFLCKKASDIPEAIKKAYYIAASGRPGPVVVDLPKSGRARQVVFPSALDAPLREQCSGRDGGEPLFPARDGGYMARTAHPSDPTKWFWRAKRRAGVPADLTYHDLRHTAASLMVRSGANVKAIQNQLGHASAAMTLDVYADLFDDDLDEVGAAMDSLLLRENVAKMLPEQPASAA